MKDAVWFCDLCEEYFEADEGGAAFSGMVPENPTCPGCHENDWVMWIRKVNKGGTELERT